MAKIFQVIMPLPSAMNRNQLQLFTEIQDIIGAFDLWPHRIQNWFLHGVPEGRGQRLRPIVAAFVWVNGLNPVVFLEWCALNPDIFSLRAIQHFQWLFQSIERGYLGYMYSYSITMGRYEKLDGSFHDTARRHQ